jgi:hypothetical protein
MIAFDLQCANGHTFEGWFEDGRAFEAQRNQGLITCPVCNDGSVSKILSTFAIKSSPSTEAGQTAPSPRHLAAVGRKIVDIVEKNFDNVGCEFAKEALKIHYGVAEPRNIRGVSTEEEEKTLKREGVQFFKFPMPVTGDGDN